MEPSVLLVIYTILSGLIAVGSAWLDHWLCQRWRKCQKRYSASKLVGRFMLIIVLMVIFAVSIACCINFAAALYTVL
ncbi:hypothetical protein PHABIO_348 [Pseudomonas phage Phabio]|uniref:Uncharacterized protein n=1 Tax=Pseudomonas phage Phabio TaxID=2006668 RepID=A0A1Y0SZM7_9CAUD|nr:hypothetical protein MZD05_gp348 [Pseudomonas phage Phabio]ARV76979.1 hypothetical protein PHABIO_348 [Pseudomonas phage Phabio]